MIRSSQLRLVAAVLLCVAAIASVVILSDEGARRALVDSLLWIRGTGAWGPAIVAALYVPACVFAVPGSLLTLGVGFVFGPVWGTAIASVGSTAGATAAFFVGRTIGRRAVERRMAASPRFRALDEAVGQQGFKIVLLTRLSPVFPFNALNYAYGLTNVRVRDYVLASWIGMFPGTLLYVYVGSAIQNLADLAAGRVEQGPWQQVGYATGLVATLVVTILLTRIARRALTAAGALPETAVDAADR